MIISIKDGLKLVAIVIIAFCAVFVCNLFFNYYIDVRAIEELLTTAEELALYQAQVLTAKFICAVSGGCLSAISVVMLIFYVRMYIVDRIKQLGILKAMGWRDGQIAIHFWTFGLSVFIGAALGFSASFIAMPYVYDSLCGTDLPAVAVNFNFVTPLALVVAPSVAFSCLACVYAYFRLRRPVGELLRGEKKAGKVRVKAKEKERKFLAEMCFSALGNKKMLAFFVAFACFCFSSMVQMSVAMLDLSSVGMGVIILIIGLALATTTLFMAVASIVNGNLKNAAVMKAFGYSPLECSLAVLGIYRLFALIGFAVGTGYQYAVLKIMVEVVFKDVSYDLEYGFDVPAFFITFVILVALYELFTFFYSRKLNAVTVKEAMSEN